MKNKWCFIAAALFLPIHLTFAACDVSQFRGQCDLPLKMKPNVAIKSLVHCGNSYGYVTQHEYELITRYQRANINLVLNINGEYIDSPCVGAAN